MLVQRRPEHLGPGSTSEMEPGKGGEMKMDDRIRQLHDFAKHLQQKLSRDDSSDDIDQENRSVNDEEEEENEPEPWGKGEAKNLQALSGVNSIWLSISPKKWDSW